MTSGRSLYSLPSAKAALREQQSRTPPAAASALGPTPYAVPSALAASDDMATSIFTFQDRQLERLGNAIRGAWSKATGEERAELDKLQTLVRLGHLSVAEAHELVAELQTRQQRAA